MNILLLGYGKMGKLIEQIALEKGHTIAAAIHEKNRHLLNTLDTSQVDVAIEFSHPEAAADNITFALNHHIPVVCGTTGWLHHKKEIDRLCALTEGTFLYASNFSLGVNLFFKLNELLAKMMAPHANYQARMKEIHHTEKKDAPSGTAISLAEGIIHHLPVVSGWVNEPTTDNSKLSIESIRENQVPGTHTVTWDSPVDSIEITHIAHSRMGFATGAVLVAEWIADKKGVLTMDDFLKL
jgi:4-hydroxy-tetrahydrodipicolinate reductase